MCCSTSIDDIIMKYHISYGICDCIIPILDKITPNTDSSITWLNHRTVCLNKSGVRFAISNIHVHYFVKIVLHVLTEADLYRLNWILYGHNYQRWLIQMRTGCDGLGFDARLDTELRKAFASPIRDCALSYCWMSLCPNAMAI